MDILQLLFDLRYFLMLAVALVVYVLFEKQAATTKLYALMLTARRMAQAAVLETGEAQEAWVLQKALIILPKQFLLFVPEAQLKVFIKFLFDKAKDYADDGNFNDTDGTNPLPLETKSDTDSK